VCVAPISSRRGSIGPPDWKKFIKVELELELNWNVWKFVTRWLHPCSHPRTHDDLWGVPMFRTNSFAASDFTAVYTEDLLTP
jgi:hypothetical protein